MEDALEKPKEPPKDLREKNHNESIKVLVRVRPLNDQEKTSNGNDFCVNIISDTSMAINSLDGKRNFQCVYDSILGEKSSQDDLYRSIQAGTRSVIDGFNSTIFAYGQTGSGKTYSMYGPSSENSHSRTNAKDVRLLGVIPRAISEIFQSMELHKVGKDSKGGGVLEYSIYCSFVQIYNENLYDMLRDVTMSQPLVIREDVTNKDMYVQGLSEYQVKSVQDTMQLLRIAEENRFVRETQMNQFSSRSHSIFQIWIEQKKISERDGGEVILKSKFNLVDLAGSEKWNINQTMQDDHITEMTNINLSLHTLGRCISSLAMISQGKDSHVPYRESKLTRLLQDSLGGNSKTYLIATISPSKTNLEESISTLKFADRAKQVMISAVINEHRPVDHALVLRLQKEVEYLKDLVRKLSGTSPSVFQGQELLQNNNKTSLDSQPSNSMSIMPTSSCSPASTLMTPAAAVPTSSLFSSSGNVQIPSMLNPNLDGYDILGSLQAALSKERKSSHVLLEENEALKTENQQLKARQENDSTSKISSGQIQEIFDLYRTFDSKMWQNIEKLQKIMKKFFKFEIEEEEMQSQSQEILASIMDMKKNRSISQYFERLITLASASSQSSTDRVSMPFTATSTTSSLLSNSLSVSQSDSNLRLENSIVSNLSNPLKSTVTTSGKLNQTSNSANALISPPIVNQDKSVPVPSHYREEVIQKQQEKYLQQIQRQMKDLQARDDINENIPLDTSWELPTKLSQSRFAKQIIQQQQRQQQQPPQQPQQPQLQLQLNQEGSLTSSSTSRGKNRNPTNSKPVKENASNTLSLALSEDCDINSSASGPSSLASLESNSSSSNKMTMDANIPGNGSLSKARIRAKAVATSQNSPSASSVDMEEHPNDEFFRSKHQISSASEVLSRPLGYSDVLLSQAMNDYGSNYSNERSRSSDSGNGNGNVSYAAANGTLNPGPNWTPCPPATNKAPSTVPQVAFRVRGGGGGGGGQNSTANTNSNVESNAMNDGWVPLGADDDDEEKLKRDLKLAKQRMKKQLQLQEWMKQKEDRQQQVFRVEEEERKAMQEAEAQREAKRKENAKKAKKKIQEYQERIRAEAEQIKELMDLGIDPQSLFQ